MAKRNRTYMIRKGKRYLIERNLDGTFGKWVTAGKKAKKSGRAKRTISRGATKLTNNASYTK